MTKRNTFYAKYLAGETQAVYKDIEKLGDQIFTKSLYKDVDKVLTETFKRVTHNIQIIHRDLKNIGYVLHDDDKNNFNKSLHPPLENTEQLLKKLDQTTHKLGHVPLSLKYFYRIVGGVNLVWDHDKKDSLMWDMADPLQVISLDALLEYIDNDHWQQDMQMLMLDNPKQGAYLDISADDLHKDNISGGQPYAIALTPKPAVDSTLLFEYHNTTFINYLRLSFQNCGFINIARDDCDNDFHDFFARVKPQLKAI